MRRKTRTRFATRVAAIRNVSPHNEKPADTAGLRHTLPLQENLERAKGFEPSTPTLARSCSTTELHPHPRGRRWCASDGQSYAKCGPRMQQPVRANRGQESTGSRLDTHPIKGNSPKSPKTAHRSPLILQNRAFRLEFGRPAGLRFSQRFEPFGEPAPQRPGQFITSSGVAIEGRPPFHERPVALYHRRDP